MTKKLSIIIPVYNVEKYIAKGLDSILKQNDKNIEIIIVNDGSTDNSLTICEKYLNKFESISIYSKKNGGLSSARNFGIEKAKGEYILFLDGDDYLDFNFLNFWRTKYSNANYDLYVFNIVEHKVSNQIVEIPSNKYFRNGLYSTKKYLNYLLFDFRLASVCNKIFNIKLFENLRFRIGKINEDEFIIHRIIGNVKTEISISNYPMYHYIRRENSITINKSPFDFKKYDVIDALIDRAVYLKNIGLKRAAYKTIKHNLYLLYVAQKKYSGDISLIKSKFNDITMQKNKLYYLIYFKYIVKLKYFRRRIMYGTN